MVTHDTIAAGRDAFLRGYVEAMLWANTFVSRPGETEAESEDVRYWYTSPGQWWQDTPVNLDDAEGFWDRFAYVILSLDYGERAELAGHDFALTRNGHGAGFWDRGLGEIGRRLTEEAKAYGEHSVIIDVDADENIINTDNN